MRISPYEGQEFCEIYWILLTETSGLAHFGRKCREPITVFGCFLICNASKEIFYRILLKIRDRDRGYDCDRNLAIHTILLLIS